MHERGAIVVGWLTKLVVAFALFTIVGFDVVSISVSHLTLTDDANTAAEAANTAYNESHGNVQAAYNAALASAEQHNARCPVRDFSVDVNGTIHLRLMKTATTLLVHGIGPLKRYAAVTSPGVASTPAN